MTMFAAEVRYTSHGETTKHFAGDAEGRFAWRDWAEAAYAAADFADILDIPGYGTQVEWCVVVTATLPTELRKRIEAE